jgi:hypothetical protein
VTTTVLGSRALSTDRETDQILTVYGPEAYTIPAALRIYCDWCAPGVTVVSRPLWLMTALTGPSSAAAWATRFRSWVPSRTTVSGATQVRPCGCLVRRLQTSLTGAAAGLRQPNMSSQPRPERQT